MLGSALLWFDAETTGLPEGNSFAGVHVLEVGALLTTASLESVEAIEAVITPTPESIAALKANPEALEMHKESGLVAALRGETEDLGQVEQDILDAINDNVTSSGTVTLAGSGIGSYDYPLIKEKMPRLAERLAYYVFDIGVARRVNLILSAGRFQPAAPDRLIPHRAFQDVEMFVSEAKKVRSMFDALYL